MSGINWSWIVLIDPDNQEPSECDCCSAVVPLFPFRQGGFGLRKPASVVQFCELCASTPAGTAYEYPDQYVGQQAMLQTANYGNNAILKHAGAFDNAPTVELSHEQLEMIQDPEKYRDLWKELTGEHA